MKQKIVTLVSAMLIFGLGCFVEKSIYANNERIGGTYVSSGVTVSIDEKKEAFYYADATKEQYFSGSIVLLSEKSCVMDSSNENFNRQIVSNIDEAIYLFINGEPYVLRKLTDEVVRVNPLSDK